MIPFDKKVKCGAEFVALRVISDGKIINFENIQLAESANSNEKLGFYIVEDVGETAAKEYGLKVGDYVLADRLSTFYKTEPVCLMEYKNIVVKTNKDRSRYFPIKNSVFVVPDKDENEDSGFFVPSKLKFGKIVAMNIADDVVFPFSIGDRVLLVKDADYISVGTKELYIYRPQSLICKIEE